jgi:hypothetical protein
MPIMRAIKIKISDLAIVAGYTRFQMRGLLDEVFPNLTPGKNAAEQRTFSPQDLLVAAVASEVEKTYGVKRSVLALIGKHLQQALTGPRIADRDARLLITFVPPTVTYIGSTTPVSEGLVVRLGPLFVKVDEYLGVSRATSEATQSVLPLHPTLVTGRRGPRSR